MIIIIVVVVLGSGYSGRSCGGVRPAELFSLFFFSSFGLFSFCLMTNRPSETGSRRSTADRRNEFLRIRSDMSGAVICCRFFSLSLSLSLSLSSVPSSVVEWSRSSSSSSSMGRFVRSMAFHWAAGRLAYIDNRRRSIEEKLGRPFDQPPPLPEEK